MFVVPGGGGVNRPGSAARTYRTSSRGNGSVNARLKLFYAGQRFSKPPTQKRSPGAWRGNGRYLSVRCNRCPIRTWVDLVFGLLHPEATGSRPGTFPPRTSSDDSSKNGALAYACSKIIGARKFLRYNKRPIMRQCLAKYPPKGSKLRVNRMRWKSKNTHRNREPTLKRQKKTIYTHTACTRINKYKLIRTPRFYKRDRKQIKQLIICLHVTWKTILLNLWEIICTDNFKKKNKITRQIC